MPKSAKKRKEKAADFTKAKLKLGKGKKLAPNVIDTTFKARSIALPSQSILRENDGDTPTTRRRLTFDDLITDTRHYSASLRRDAIMGLRELLEANWTLVESSMITVINACARLIGDEDVNVRKALLAFFTWLLPRVPYAALVPLSPVLLLFATFALTHIFPEIRIDAVRFLDLLLEYAPYAVTAGWNKHKAGHGRRILEGYLGLLNANTKFLEENGSLSIVAASVALTPVSKLVVLRSLSTFFRVSLSSHMGTSSTKMPELSSWLLASSFRQAESYKSLENLFLPSSAGVGVRTFEKEVDANDDDFICPPLSGLFTDSPFTLQEVVEPCDTLESLDISKSDVSDINLIMLLARTLHSTLIATFLDCAPPVFSPSTRPPETEVQLILATSRIVRILYGVILQAPVPVRENHRGAPEDLESILGHMAPYFPFTSSHGPRDIKVEEAFQELSLIFCELSSLLALTPYGQTTHVTQRAKRAKGVYGVSNAEKPNQPPSIRIERVSEYIVRLLHVIPIHGVHLGPALTPTSYLALLPAIWALLNNTFASHREVSNAVLHAIVNHSLKTSHKSSMKRLTIEFVGRLLLLSTEHSYHGNFLIEHSTSRAIFAEWITHLPQTLWEFGSNDLAGSQSPRFDPQLILIILLRVCQRVSRVLQASEAASTLRSKLVPYFSINHPVRGWLPGPYGKLPVASPHRRLVLDVVATLLSKAKQEEGQYLSAAVELAVAGTGECHYWAQIRQAVYS